MYSIHRTRFSTSYRVCLCFINLKYFSKIDKDIKTE